MLDKRNGYLSSLKKAISLKKFYFFTVKQSPIYLLLKFFILTCRYKQSIIEYMAISLLGALMFRKIKCYIKPYIVFSVLSLSFIALPDTKIPEALKEASISVACKNKLIRIADNLIGKKKHRILEHNVSDSDAFHAFILLSYNDQDSHVSYTAIPSENGDCQVNMNESFELPAPCPDARNSIFKRWEMLGRLDEHTIVVRYDHPRKKEERLADENARAMGFLTQTRRGTSCLVTRQQQNMPLPPMKKDE